MGSTCCPARPPPSTRPAISSTRERYQITGWRKRDAEVAAFTFTDLPDSYAARTGRPANVGVIGIALFRERRRPSVWVPPPRPPVPSEAPLARESDGIARGNLNGPEFLAGSAAKPNLAAPQTQSAPALPAASDRALADVAGPEPAPRDKLGTGHGEREYSYATPMPSAGHRSAPPDGSGF